MTRAALLPAGSDPFVIAYWLRNFALWAKDVDELHIAVCGPLEPEPLAYIEERVAAFPNASMEHIPKRTLHGEVMARLLTKTRADTIMFCEDDAYIRRPEIVDESFRFAESGGIVATPRGGYAGWDVIEAAREAFGDGDSFWPCFVFVPRAALEATDGRFGGIVWHPGDVILGKTLTETSGSDTFVWASYQLRSQGLPERIIDNHRLSGQEVPNDAPWFHVGSLSGGHGLMFMGDTTEDRYRFEVGMFQQLPPGNAWQRFGWWQRAWETADGIPEYHARYAVELARFRDAVGLTEAEVESYRPIADGLVTWNDRP